MAKYWTYDERPWSLLEQFFAPSCEAKIPRTPKGASCTCYRASDPRSRVPGPGVLRLLGACRGGFRFGTLFQLVVYHQSAFWLKWRKIWKISGLPNLERDAEKGATDIYWGCISDYAPCSWILFLQYLWHPCGGSRFGNGVAGSSAVAKCGSIMLDSPWGRTKNHEWDGGTGFVFESWKHVHSDLPLYHIYPPNIPELKGQSAGLW